MAFVAAAPALALALGAGGAAASAFGTLQSGAAASSAASYQAQVARNNALIAQQNADYAIASGNAKATTESLKGAAVAGKIKAGQAASGINVNEGSAVDVQASQREQEKLDTETVIANAQLQSYGYRTTATGYTAEAALDEAKGQSAMTGAEIGAAGSLLSNASSLGFKWSGGTGTGGGNNFTGVGNSPY